MSLAARFVLALIGLYQRAVVDRPSPCRFVPTCSNYAIDAVHAHGAIRGSWMGVRRICRCNPWGPSGWDPVPARRGN